MSERPYDPNSLWKFPRGGASLYPGMDAKMAPIAVRTVDDGAQMLVEAVGTDGRFLGAIRPFPGMADVTIHGVPTPGAGFTITTINNIVFAKYAAVQKGQSSHTLKGIVYIADNQAGTGQAVYFAYRDSQTGTSDVVLLENFKQWTDFSITNLIDYDITSMGKYIYLVASADTTTTVSSVSGKEAPYNKAYFWDFKVNTWDAFVTGFSQRFLGLLPERILGVLVNADGTGAQVSSTQAYQTVQDAAGTYDLADGNYTFGVELVSRKHNVRSYLRRQSKNPIGTPASLAWRVFRTALAETNRQIENVTGADPCVAHAWGLSHFDGVKLYRTPVDDLQEIVGATQVVYDPYGQLYVQADYLERNSGAGVFNDETFDFKFGTDAGDHTYMNDAGIVQQHAYNPTFDDFGPAPRMKRLAAYDQMLVGITDVREPSTPTAQWSENDRQPESFVWSMTTRYPAEPENFPPGNIYQPDDPAEKFLALEAVGDYLFGISNSGIYRITKSGAQLVVNKLHYRTGGVSRFGQTGVGNSLFIVTKTGLKEVDGNSGEIRSVSAIDRIIIDDSEWGTSLSSVRLAYDAALGALILLNTTKRECILLWEGTGAVTKIVDCPWTFLTSGPEVLTDGSHRAYFITSTGTVHVIDAFRQMGKRSMCGSTITEKVNGTVDLGVTSTIVRDLTANFPANCVGHKVYMTSGAQIGSSATVVTRVSATQLVVSGFPGDIAIGDKYAISPVVTRIVFPSLAGAGGEPDPFVVKKVAGVSVSLAGLGGETASSDPNASLTMGVKREGVTIHSSTTALNVLPDRCKVHLAGVRETRPFVFVESLGANMDYEIEAVKISGELTGSEAQSIQG